VRPKYLNVCDVFATYVPLSCVALMRSKEIPMRACHEAGSSAQPGFRSADSRRSPVLPQLAQLFRNHEEGLLIIEPADPSRR
jgi:hypothetical protein